MPPASPPFTVLPVPRRVLAVPPVPRAHSLLDPHFSRALGLKLRRLQQQQAPAAPAPAPPPPRPRFVTTVTQGRFLPPPPTLAALLGLEHLYPAQPPLAPAQVYSYSSRPQALAPRARPRRAAPPPAALLQQREERGALAGLRAIAMGVVGLHRLEDANAEKHGNLMHDKRVVRGNTFAAHPMAHGDGGAGGPAAGTAAARRLRARARRAAMRLRPGTPPPAPGRRHHPVQTELYLEELFDKGQEMTVGVQTDLFLDRPATPLYVPAKTGADAYTQIYPGDLFDFDVEVAPVLEALVGGTATQALGEVAREEELAALRQHQRRFRELRDAERAERRRLAEHDHRLHLEKEQRVAAARAAAAAAGEARARAAAAVLVQGYVAELLPAALAGLRDQGYLVERTKRGVEDEFMPWLVTEVSRELECIITSRDVITELVREVVEARAELYGSAGERDAARESLPDSVTLPSQLEEEHAGEVEE